MRRQIRYRRDLQVVDPAVLPRAACSRPVAKHPLGMREGSRKIRVNDSVIIDHRKAGVIVGLDLAMHKARLLDERVIKLGSQYDFVAARKNIDADRVCRTVIVSIKLDPQARARAFFSERASHIRAKIETEPVGRWAASVPNVDVKVSGESGDYRAGVQIIENEGTLLTPHGISEVQATAIVDAGGVRRVGEPVKSRPARHLAVVEISIEGSRETTGYSRQGHDSEGGSEEEPLGESIANQKVHGCRIVGSLISFASAVANQECRKCEF